MIITGSKQIYKKIANDREISPELVTSIGNFVWADLNDRVGMLRHREIYMYRLGCFRFRKLKTESLLPKLEESKHLIKFNITDPEEKQKYLDNIDYKIGRITELLKEWEKVIEEKLEFRRKRNEAKSFNRDISEQDKDLGGTKE